MKGEENMKKAITILALILMIFAVSCSNDTPAPANEIPQKTDLVVSNPTVPEEEVTSDILQQFSAVISTITTGDATKITEDSWQNEYDGDGAKVYTIIDGECFVINDGRYLRAGDSVRIDQGALIVNGVTYTADTTAGKQYIEDLIDLNGSVVRTVASAEVEKVFVLTEPSSVEGEPDAEYVITVKGTATSTTDKTEENGNISNLMAYQIDLTIAPAYNEITTARVNVYEVIETDEATDLNPDPQPYKDPKYVLTVGDTSYDAALGSSEIDVVIGAIFN